MIRLTHHKGSRTWSYDVQVGNPEHGFYASATGSGEPSRAAAMRFARIELRRLRRLEAAR